MSVQVGHWAFQLKVDDSARFPNVDAVIPKEEETPTRLVLDLQDAAFLKATLPRMPGAEDECSPVTLDLDENVRLRSREKGQDSVAELILERSKVSGPPVRVVTDRQYLCRALQLGFLEVRLGKPEGQIVCRQEGRVYLWMSLTPEGVIPPTRGALRVGSATFPGESPKQREKRSPAVPRPSPDPPEGKDAHSGPLPPAQRRPAPAPRPELPANAERNGSAQERPMTLEEAIASAEEIRSELQEAQVRLSRLISALKLQRKQARVVRAAVESLRQLQPDLQPREPRGKP